MNMMHKVMTAGALGLWLLAAPTAGADSKTEVVRDALKKIIPTETPDEIREAPIAGFYEVSYGAEIFYISEDARHVFQGDLYDLEAQANLTEAKRSEYRVGLMDRIDPKEAIVFGPEQGEPRYTVRVFTDVDCTYCRKLHRQIADYNDRGIEIRYLAYPRTGVNTPSYHKAVSVWCSEDRKAAITTAKAGKPVPRKSCDNPVLGHMSIANQVGVTGTPTLVFADGSVMPGYASPDQLLEYLDARFQE